MNNWDKRPLIEVVTTNVALPHLTNIITNMVLDDSIKQEPKLVDIQEEYYFVTHKDTNIEFPTIHMALECLKDHMDNTPIGEWAEVQGDMLVDVEDELYVTKWAGTYHAPKIDIKVTYYEA